MELDQEVVYGTHEDSHVVMSEKVQSLAGSIYQEFEKMIGKYDEEVVKDLMPLVVNVLESLDLSYTENQEHEVELELLREDNEQLVTQYEREKQLRKTSEQKLLEVEDAGEDERKELSSKVESLESIVRMLELKSKNSADHVTRLEEKESEHQREFSKLHTRYTELFKTHMDSIERAKPSLGVVETSRSRIPAAMIRSAGPLSLGFASLEQSTTNQPRDISECSGPATPPSPWSPAHSGAGSLRLELVEAEAPPPSPPATATPSATGSAESPETPRPELPSPAGRSHTNREQRSGNTLYQELSFHDSEALGEMDDGADITGSWVHPGDFASSVNDNFFGMGKEVENLIMENNELLATKNALNIVKDDLIEQVDELTAQHEISRAQLKAAASARVRLETRVSELEEELRRTRDELENTSRANRSDDDEDVPMAQRKRFTRVEMARVLMERNQYKERFMELQEAVRWTEMIRASRHEPELDRKSKQSVWKFFSSLFGPTERRPLGAGSGSVALAPATPALAAVRRRAALGQRRDMAEEKMAQRRNQERRDQLRQVRAHVGKEDGRLQAYGWSLPARATSRGSQPAGHVPVPVYCRPLAEDEPGTKIWCAAGACGGVGLTGDGGVAVGGSVFYRDPNANDQAGQPPKAHGLDSLVWICTSAHAVGRVTVVDANNPADVLDAFDVCASHLLCIASVPGASEGDYGTEPSDWPTETEEELEGSEGREAGHVRVACSSPAPEEVPSRPDHAHPSPPALRLQRELTPAAIDGRTPGNADSGLVGSVQPTMWLGAQDGTLYVHSAVAHWRRRLHAAKLRDAILGIVHVSGRVVVALADGTVAAFSRDVAGAWDLSRFLLLDLGRPHHSIRCLAAVGDTVWCGYRNQLHVVQPRTLAVLGRVDAHPRKESQVRQLAPQGEGVWVSIRLDSTLRLFHAKTLQHLQDVDIEPYVSKMLAVFPGGTGKLGFSFVRITALLIAGHRLWIGTGNGVVISVPLTASGGGVTAGGVAPGGGIRVTDAPFCSMAQAQLSFHGHRDAVKFFVAVPGSGSVSGDNEPGKTETGTSMLVMSGGEGYIDFRVGDPDDDAAPGDLVAPGNEDLTRPERSHLVVWQLSLPG